MSMPYIIRGTVTDSDGNVVDTPTVKIRNETTNELIIASSNSSGQYIADIANLASGYLQTDRITVYCNYQSEYSESSFLISSDTHTVNISLEVIEDTETIYYCTVQDVWDELDEKNSSNISAHRIVKSIQRAESEIEEQTNSAFRQVTVTNEIYDWNQYTGYKSAEQLRTVNTLDRHDHWNVFWDDTIKLNKSPIVSITSLYKNQAYDASTDSWTQLTEQTGSGGDFITYKKEGLIKFVNNPPRFGKRSIKITYIYGRTSVPKIVEKLTILLAIRDILLSKISGAQFSSTKSISVDGLSISGGMNSNAVYLKTINNEIDKCWDKVGSFSSEVV